MTTRTINDNIVIVNNDVPTLTDGQFAFNFIANNIHEHDCQRVTINKAAVTEDFFKLSTGLAGEVVQKFVIFGCRVAIVGNFSGYTSKPLKDYMYECNIGKHLFIASTEQEAIDKFKCVAQI